jgi:hypothetical protein
VLSILPKVRVLCLREVIDSSIGNGEFRTGVGEIVSGDLPILDGTKGIDGIDATDGIEDNDGIVDTDGIIDIDGIVERGTILS